MSLHPQSADAEEILAQAWHNYDAGRLDEAIGLARRALALSPQRPNGASALAWFLLEGNQSQEAEVVLRTAIERHPDFAPLHWYLGLLHQRNQALDDARDSLTRALQLNPGLAEAAVSLAWVLHDQGRFAEAFEWSERALEQRASADTQAQLGWLYLVQDRAKEAVAQLEAALAAQPELVSARCHLASALQRLERKDEAKDILQQGLASFPDNPELLLAQGWLAYHEGNLQDAGAAAESLLQQQPGSTAAWHLLGQVRLARGELDEADRCLASAEQRDGANIDVQVQRAVILRGKQQPAEASTLLRSILARAPHSLSARVELINTLADLGHFAEATELARGIPSDRAGPEHQARLGWLLLQQGRFAEAAGLLGAVVTARPNLGHARCDLAAALDHLGRFDEAKAILDEGLRISPNAPDLQLAIGWLHYRRGDLPSAQEAAELVTQAHAEQADGWFLLGIIRRDRLHPREAEQCLSEALARCEVEAGSRPQRMADPATTKLKTRILLELGRTSEARTLVHQLLKSCPRDGAYWQLLAEALLQKRQYHMAVLALSRAARFAPASPDFWRQSAWLALAAEDLRAARVALSHLQSLTQDDPANDVLAASILAASGDLQEAARRAERAVSQAPDSADAWRTLATVRTRQDRLTEAEAAIRTALRCNPENCCDAYRQLGWICLGKYRHREAIAAFERAVDNKPKDAPSWYGLAEAHRAAGQFPDALRAIQTALRLRSKWDEARRLRGNLVAEQIYYFMKRTWQYFDETPLAQSRPRFKLSEESAANADDQAPRRPRVLVIDDASTHRGNSTQQRRAELMLLALRGCDITVFLTRATLADQAAEYASLPPVIEIVFEAPTCALEPFLENHSTRYDSVIVRQRANMARVANLAERRADLLRNLRVIFDADANLAHDEMQQDSALGETTSRTNARQHPRSDFDLARQAHLVLATSMRETDRFRAAGIPNVCVLDDSAANGDERWWAESGTGYDYVICSLSTKSHLPLMRTLTASVRRHFSGKVYLLLIDSDDESLIPEDATLVRLHDIIAPSAWAEMVERYNILEQCCVLKPYLMRFLARTVNCPIIYLDADTYLLAPLDPLLPARPNFSVLLTPHLVFPFTGERHAQEIGMLRAGVYNAGLVGVGAGSEGVRFLDWWLDRSSKYAYDAQEQGIFTDQRWLDLVPSLFRNVHVSRETGLNVGHWRAGSEADFGEDPLGRLTFCRELVTLIHMSGFKPNRPDRLAQHLPTAVSGSSALGRFLRKYAFELTKNKLPTNRDEGAVRAEHASRDGGKTTTGA